jgi:hypothetical protein
MHVRLKNERTLHVADGRKIICQERQEPRSALLCGSVSLQVFRYYDRPSVCNVGLSTAEVTAKPLSDWNAANAPRLSSHESIQWSRVKHNTFHSFPFYSVRSFNPACACAVAMFLITPAADAQPQITQLLPL